MAFSGVPRKVRNAIMVGAAAVTVTTACGPVSSGATSGNPADFAVNIATVNNFPGSYLQRWNPCTPVHYRVDDRLVPSALANVKAAIASLSKATGITFIYDGLAAYVPNSGQWNQPADLVISFAKHTGQSGGSNYLAGGNQLGEGGFQAAYYTMNGKVTSYKIVKGYAVIDAAGYNASSSKVKMATLLHELGHAVGLNHAHFASEIMYPVVSNNGAGAYSSGDLAGLKKVGRTSGCLS